MADQSKERDEKVKHILDYGRPQQRDDLDYGRLQKRDDKVLIFWTMADHCKEMTR
jgi:hypothetical protein